MDRQLGRPFFQWSDEAYGAAGEPHSNIFRGLCAKFKISAQCFERLVEDGLDDPGQLRDMGSGWKDHVLALDPNGIRSEYGDDAGPLDVAVPKANKKKSSSPLMIWNSSPKTK